MDLRCYVSAPGDFFFLKKLLTDKILSLVRVILLSLVLFPSCINCPEIPTPAVCFDFFDFKSRHIIIDYLAYKNNDENIKIVFNKTGAKTDFSSECNLDQKDPLCCIGYGRTGNFSVTVRYQNKIINRTYRVKKIDLECAPKTIKDTFQL